MIELHEQVNIIQQISSRVRNFNRRNDYLWNWSCDICGDSKKDLRKARFYVGRNDTGLSCFCHNCGYSSSLINYIHYQHPDIAKQLTQKSFLDQQFDIFDPSSLVRKLDDDILTYIFFIDKHQEKNNWINELKSRKILVDKVSLKRLLTIHNNYWKVQK